MSNLYAVRIRRRRDQKEVTLLIEAERPGDTEIEIYERYSTNVDFLSCHKVDVNFTTPQKLLIFNDRSLTEIAQ